MYNYTDGFTKFCQCKIRGYLIDKFKSRLRVKWHIASSFYVTLTRLHTRGNKLQGKKKLELASSHNTSFFYDISYKEFFAWVLTKINIKKL